MSRSAQGRVAGYRGRALALTMAAMLVGACGDDSGDEDKGASGDGGRGDAQAATDSGRDAAVDAASDAARDANIDANTPSEDAAVDSGSTDARVTDAGDAGPRELSTPGDDAPTLSAVVYFKDMDDPRILLSGRDQNGDVDTFTIKFYTDTAATMAAVVDLDNDPATRETSYTSAVVHDPASALFVAKFVPTLDLVTNVGAIKVQVKDKGGRTSNEVTAVKADSPKKAQGAKCDPDGFDTCSSPGLCAPNNTGYVCQNATSARTAACSQPLQLSPPTVTSVMGSVGSTSLWSIPASCAGGDGKSAGDRVVKLHIEQAGPVNVTLSTNNDGTNFDTAIYSVRTPTGGNMWGTAAENLKACQDAPMQTCTAQPCGFCESDILNQDNTANPKTTLVLNGLVKGDYYIVVDTQPAVGNGNMFTLTANITP